MNYFIPTSFFHCCTLVAQNPPKSTRSSGPCCSTILSKCFPVLLLFSLAAPFSHVAIEANNMWNWLAPSCLLVITQNLRGILFCGVSRTFQNATLSARQRMHFRGFEAIFFCYFTPCKTLKRCFGTHQLTRSLSTDVVTVPRRALWRTCEKKFNLCAWSLCSLHLTQTHIWGRLCVLSVYSLPSLSRQWETTVLSIESLLYEREKRFSWTVSVEIE